MVIALINNRQFGLPHILRLIYGKQGDDHTFSPPESVQEHQYDLQFHLCRGITFYHLGEYDRAIGDFGKALRLNWRDENVAYWLDKAEQARRDIRSRSETSPMMAPQEHSGSPVAVRN